MSEYAKKTYNGLYFSTDFNSEFKSVNGTKFM